MALLFNWRIWAALVVAVFLAGTHWKVYVAGKKTIQAEWDAEKIILQQKAMKAAEINRLKSIALGKEAERVDRELQEHKAARMVSDRVADDRLRDLNAALGRPTSDKASTPGGIDDPRDAIIGECAESVVRLDKTARRLVEKVSGLQGYVQGVCLN